MHMTQTMLFQQDVITLLLLAQQLDHIVLNMMLMEMLLQLLEQDIRIIVLMLVIQTMVMM